MVDMGTYECKYLNTGEITPADFFTNAYAEQVHEFQEVRTLNKLLCVSLYAKYKNGDLQKVVKNQC